MYIPAPLDNSKSLLSFVFPEKAPTLIIMGGSLSYAMLCFNVQDTIFFHGFSQFEFPTPVIWIANLQNVPGK